MAVSSFNIGEVEGSVKALSDQVRNEVTDLNTPLTTGTSVPVLNYYQSTASNKPTGNSGIVFTMFDGAYRMQTVFELAGKMYARYYASGTITPWTSLSDKIANWGIPIDVRSQLTLSKCTLNAAGMSLINKMVTYFFDFSITSAVSNGDEIITGMETPIGTFNNVQYVTATNASTPSEQKHFVVRDGGKLMALESISASTRYRCTFTYFTN